MHPPPSTALKRRAVQKQDRLSGSYRKMRGDYRRRTLSVLVGTFLICAVVALHSDDARKTSEPHEWPLVHGNPSNDRYSTLEGINTHTVKQLGGAWVSKKFEDAASSRSSPVVKDGAMYVTAGTRVYALSAKTGATRWICRSSVVRSCQVGAVV